MKTPSNPRRKLAAGALALHLCACAQLHHVDISDMETSRERTPFDIKASETGLELGEASSIARDLSTAGSAVNEVASGLSLAWALVTYGPRTGKLTFSDSYGEQLMNSLDTICPSGRIGSLVSIRESNKYPVVSGEIARFSGYCISNSTLKESQ